MPRSSSLHSTHNIIVEVSLDVLTLILFNLCSYFPSTEERLILLGGRDNYTKLHHHCQVIAKCPMFYHHFINNTVYVNFLMRDALRLVSGIPNKSPVCLPLVTTLETTLSSVAIIPSNFILRLDCHHGMAGHSCLL